MSNQEEIFSDFKRKAADIINKYTINTSYPEYGNQYLRMSSFFGVFNNNMIDLENDLNLETANILSKHVNEDMDLPGIIDNLCAFTHSAKLQYIQSVRPLSS